MTPYEARQGVVMVRGIIYDTEGNSQWGWGTGWAIGKPGEPVEYIVTNGHVVADAYEYPQQYPNEIFGSVEVYYSAAENDFAQAEIVYYSPQTQKDIAILRLPSPTEKRIALSLRESDSVKPGDTAYALGYPGNAVANQPLPKYDMNDVTMTKGIISNRTTLTSTTYEAFQMDVSIAGGNSGGPLVDESGNVMGINVATAYDLTTGQLSDVHYAIVIDELTKILDSERIAYTMAGGGLSWTQPWFAYAFLPLGILALAGGAVLLVLTVRRGGACWLPQALALAKRLSGAARSALRFGVLPGNTPARALTFPEARWSSAGTLPPATLSLTKTPPASADGTARWFTSPTRTALSSPTWVRPTARFWATAKS